MIASSIRMPEKIAGIVLAGGRSSRMGENKALLHYCGRPLVDHMANILRQAGCENVHISGAVPGHAGIPDGSPHSGPARAIGELLRRFSGHYDALLFMPVDMPLMTVDALKCLLAAGSNAYFSGHPLPALLKAGVALPVCDAVHELLQAAGAKAIPLPLEMESVMTNVNTKEEWRKFVP